MNGQLNQRTSGVLWVVIAVLAGGLVTFSQAGFSYVNEGFDLLAAQLINAGKRPYLDFFYPHAPLYAYVAAAWMRLFGETWRSAHIFSALLTAGCTALVGTFVFSRLRETRWGLAAAICAALFHGLNVLIVQFGGIGQAYAICLLLSVASFRLAIEAVEQPRPWFLFFAGLCAGTAAVCSLLIVPVAFVLLIWISRHSPSGQRLRRSGSFFVGVAISFLAMLGMRIQGMRQMLFDNIEYHLFYRRLGEWEQKALIRWDLGVWTAWLSSTQGLLLVVLAFLGLLSLAELSQWDARRKAEFELCAWITVALGAFLAVTRPTFIPYFVLLIPFLSILASIGVYAVGSRIWPSGRPVWLVLGISALFAFELAILIHQRPWLVFGWETFEGIAAQVNSVTAPAAPLYVDDDRIYFAARRIPPPGLENVYGTELRLSPELSALLHVVPQSRVDEWLAEGRFATVSVLVDDPRVDSLHLARMYSERMKVDGHYVFWDKVDPETKDNTQLGPSSRKAPRR